MAISVRTRFEVFKRDEFTCQYCGRRSPDVVLQADHIVPVASGGSDDVMNLTTSCWECNSGKSCVPLATVVTGEDPHDRAVMLLERERQLHEYNNVIALDKERRDSEAWQLLIYWNTERGYTGEASERASSNDYWWMLNTLTFCPREQVREFLDYALFRGFTKNLRYVMACVRNWRERQSIEVLEPEAEALAEADRAIQEYERAKSIEEVLYQVREAEHWRRSIGYCPHDPDCGPGTLDCVQRQVRVWMGIDPNNRSRLE